MWTNTYCDWWVLKIVSKVSNWLWRLPSRPLKPWRAIYADCTAGLLFKEKGKPAMQCQMENRLDCWVVQISSIMKKKKKQHSWCHCNTVRCLSSYSLSTLSVLKDLWEIIALNSCLGGKKWYYIYIFGWICGTELQNHEVGRGLRRSSSTVPF